MSIVVVLPAPFGPRNPKAFPARTSKSTSATAWIMPSRSAVRRAVVRSAEVVGHETGTGLVAGGVDLDVGHYGANLRLAENVCVSRAAYQTVRTPE